MRFQPVKCNIMQITRKLIKKTNDSCTTQETVLHNVEKKSSILVLPLPTIRNGIHISAFICTKANRAFGLLSRNFAVCPQDVKESAYKGRVHLVLEYGSSIWDPQSILLQDELEKV